MSTMTAELIAVSVCSCAASARLQGLTLVHFSAQPKPLHLPVSPCLIDWGESCTQCIQQNVLSLSPKVDECKPLPGSRPPTPRQPP
jgi:hypothetical protein